MGNVIVKYKLNGVVVSSEDVEKNKLLFDSRCFGSQQKTDAILKLRDKNKDVILFIDENFNLTTEDFIPEKE